MDSRSGNKGKSENLSEGDSTKTETDKGLESAKGKKDHDWTLKCLNIKCKDIHGVRKFPITSEEEKDKLLAQYLLCETRTRIPYIASTTIHS
jgi:hypothetical protein